MVFSKKKIKSLVINCVPQGIKNIILAWHSIGGDYILCSKLFHIMCDLF